MVNTYGWAAPEECCEQYVKACENAFKDEEVFNNFKTLEDYRVILEHVDENLGREYYKHVVNTDSDFMDQFYDKFTENDIQGNPTPCNYGNHLLSPTTVRYIKNTLDISYLCKDIDVVRIAEVGGGYGGLCKTISSCCDFDTYYQIDLPSVVKLQEKYLKMFDISPKVKYVSCNKLKQIKDIDLFISNYAFSECDLETQNLYYDKVIKNSKSVYITYNTIFHGDSVVQQFKQKLISDGFNLIDEFRDYGYHSNIIIAGVR